MAAIPLILGHRGASAWQPENSLRAFERALADGADGVEFDVRLCASGEVVVFHDEDLTRLGGEPARIGDLSWNDLRGRRLLSGVTMPLLDEVLDVLAEARLINIELKVDGCWDPRATRLAIAVQEILGMRPTTFVDRVVVSSFDARILRRIAARAPKVRRGFLFEDGAGWRLRGGLVTRWLAVDAVHPQHTLCTPRTVAAWHARGKTVNVWTADHPERVRALRDMGVDAIIANDPGAARVALAG